MGIWDQFSLNDKVVVITGGSGLYGKCMTIACVEAGARTYITTRNKDGLKKLEDEYAEMGFAISALYMDQEKPESIRALRETLAEREGRCDVLVNNAVARMMKSYDDPLDVFAASMNINATGLFEITRVFGDWMGERGSGSIINIGSIQGMISPDATLYEGLNMDGYIPDYSFHKGGMISFTRFAASYYGRRGVRCNCICPGGMISEKVSAEFVKRYSDRTLLGRMADSSDIGGSIVFLASDASLYVTGVILPVDGGYMAK
ncbi:SDR family oxidoreductase [Paenibacillus psychroresistens]|uniref:SDR family oxidoreductase n=1 Tax=Paenibacillus psychroresistens TaxID=1778678 RepID=A0A6B8RJ19_9BACL|nr:SDR family oxidoreductase [Paenibacillus psychroresistens]QGQ95582.1 SDR family oxidoreductase [Paenibacillus psychroresistens]